MKLDYQFFWFFVLFFQIDVWISVLTVFHRGGEKGIRVMEESTWVEEEHI